MNKQSGSTDDFIPALYDELRRLAAMKLSKEHKAMTLQATALVHEVYLRLSQGAGDADVPPKWRGESHFFAAAAEAMRRILIENSRRKASAKRGGQWKRVVLERMDLLADREPEQIVAVDEALDRLEENDEQAAQLVKLHFIAGLTFKEAAALLGVSERTAKRKWAFARAWLEVELSKQVPEVDSAQEGSKSPN